MYNRIYVHIYVTHTPARTQSTNTQRDKHANACNWLMFIGVAMSLVSAILLLLQFAVLIQCKYTNKTKTYTRPCPAVYRFDLL